MQASVFTNTSAPNCTKLTKIPKHERTMKEQFEQTKCNCSCLKIILTDTILYNKEGRRTA